jgi:choline-sulfatase
VPKHLTRIEAAALLAAVVSAILVRHHVGTLDAAAAAPRLNIVLMTIDTLRADHIGAYGDRAAITPNIDELARRGTRFDQALAHAPLTFPSHASILTGQLPVVHGARDNGWEVLGAETLTVAERLKIFQYQTAAFVSSFILSAQFGLDRGFDVYDDHLRSSGPLIDLDLRRPADDVSSAAGTWMLAHADRPFFAWVHFYDPHAPYGHSSGSRSPYDVAVSAADSGVGRVMAAVARAGVAGRTAVIVTADHGEGLGDHGERQHGLLLYDSVVRVPLIIWTPGMSARVVSSQVRHVDIVPTILGLLGAPIPSGLPGYDLCAPLRAGASTCAAGKDDEAYGESWYGRLHLGWSDIRYLRSDGWKYIDAPDPELFEVRRDPGEATNLASRRPELAAAMKTRLSAMAPKPPDVPQTSRPAPDGFTVERLRALGYVAGGDQAGTSRRPADPNNRPDPKRMVASFEAYESALNDGIGELVASRPVRAVARFRKLVHDYPESYGAHHYLGYAMAAMHRDAEAIVEYERALQLNPEYAIADFDLARSLGVLGRHREAAARVESGRKLEPRSVYGVMTEGVVAWAREDNRAARQAFERATSLAPEEPRGFANLGEACMRAADMDCAQRAFGRLVDLGYARAAAHFNLGIIAERRGRKQDAITEYRKALSDDARLEQARSALRKLESY